MLDRIDPLAALGSAIRDARLARGESLREAAAAVGISPSMMSQIETSRSAPSVKTLRSVADHLRISIDDLFGLPATFPALLSPVAEVAAPAVQRRADDPVVAIDGVTWRRLASDGTDGVVPLVGTFLPAAQTSIGAVAPRADGTLNAYVLEGSLTVVLGDDAHVLRVGDSVAVPQRRHRVFVNHTRTPARLLCYACG
jgi:transcriptional regulator with XRE-family HTH domain